MVDEPIVIRDVREEGSFDAFFGDRFAELSRLAFLLTGSSAVADEIAQDACEQCFDAGTTSHTRGPMPGWRWSTVLGRGAGDDLVGR